METCLLDWISISLGDILTNLVDDWLKNFSSKKVSWDNQVSVH